MHNHYLPNITSRQKQPGTDSIMRRKNLSLSGNNQQGGINERSSTHAQERCDFIYVSRKNQLLIKKARFRGKDLTRLCQDNLAEYLSLKNKVTEPYASPAGQTRRRLTQRHANVKVSAKLFNLPSSFTPGKNTHSEEHHRSKTENQPYENQQEAGSLGKGVSKKYSQMSLKEIVEGGDGFQLFTRIKDFKSKIRESIKRKRKESQDYEIEGW